eukprot:CAMPEP_0181171654 /NCGR_PEP_ID=MMETSP1096-20121128/2028_1 /TAXON_ID=156174 ORGANISM="Chrysochromulina ericina, Strain CCMP281" /NCGR_SAMPLE_ID=MMETSP1096 /ASSEMBLY_ACC=CAM_ASM_000453 /LENGTH=68 /DNA_ID=CAMNT_0023259323 /DNA_START=168 /DNA_END=370 /DNA_ORIENTATION=+
MCASVWAGLGGSEDWPVRAEGAQGAQGAPGAQSYLATATELSWRAAAPLPSLQHSPELLLMSLGSQVP